MKIWACILIAAVFQESTVLADAHQLQTFLSDASWKVSTFRQDGWEEAGFNDSDWPCAVPDGEPTWFVTYPDFRRDCRGFADRKL